MSDHPRGSAAAVALPELDSLGQSCLAVKRCFSTDIPPMLDEALEPLLSTGEGRRNDEERGTKAQGR
jgi:hypothetical protein